MAEYLDVIDDNGNLTGETVAREVAHRDGIRHRTSHLWLLRKKDGALQILLQKRSADKPSFPNCYDISSAGHIPAGGEFASSALRRIKRRAGNYRGGKRFDRLWRSECGMGLCVSGKTIP